MREEVHSELIIFPSDNTQVVKEKKAALERAQTQKQSRQLESPIEHALPLEELSVVVEDAVRKGDWQLAGWLQGEIQRVKTEQ